MTSFFRMKKCYEQPSTAVHGQLKDIISARDLLDIIWIKSVYFNYGSYFLCQIKLINGEKSFFVSAFLYKQVSYQCYTRLLTMSSTLDKRISAFF